MQTRMTTHMCTPRVGNPSTDEVYFLLPEPIFSRMNLPTLKYRGFPTCLYEPLKVHSDNMFVTKRRIIGANSGTEKEYGAVSLTAHMVESVSVKSDVFGLWDEPSMDFGE